MNRKQFSEDTYKTLLFLIEHPEFKDKIGTALIQRTFRIGYGRAADVIDELCECKIIERPTVKGIGSYCTLLVSLDEIRKILEPQSEGLTMIEKIENYKGKVLPIVGRPGIGQESVALQIALEYTKFTSKSVLIFSPIQPKREIQMRLVSIRDGYNYYWAKSRTLSQQTIERFNGYVRGMDFSQPSVDDTEDISEEYIINRISNTEDIGMVVMLDFDFYSEKVSVAFLRMVAEQMQIPIVVSCLVQREVDDRDDCHPRREDMRSSDLAKMDTVLLVYRESYYDLDCIDMTTELLVDRGETKEVVMLRYNRNRIMFYTIK